MSLEVEALHSDIVDVVGNHVKRSSKEHCTIARMDRARDILMPLRETHAPHGHFHFSKPEHAGQEKLVAPLLLAILVLAFLLRIVGINYGLPLTLVDDEPPFILASLQMLDARTVLPFLHPELFSNILYYPPYLSYIFLLPFAGIVGVLYLMWDGTAGLFQSHLLTDLSPFFLAARFGTVLFGVLSVYLVYRTGEALFRSKTAGLASAFLLATSLLHIALSMVARHWLLASLVYLLVLYILSREHVPENRRYAFSLVVIALGMGFSSISVFALILVGLWYLALGSSSLVQLLRDRVLLASAAFSLILAPLPSLLNARTNGFVVDLTISQTKTAWEFLMSPVSALSEQLYSEPILIALFLVGLVLLWKHHRRLGVLLALFVCAYAALFYLLFRFEARFMLPLVPIYALLGGYALSRFLNHRLGIAAAVLLSLVLCSSAVRLSYLAYTGDTRSLAREWALTQLSAGDSVIVYARLTRLPTKPDAVAELRAIDEKALRKVDVADERLNDPRALHALNLYSVQDAAFYATLPEYARTSSYRYLLYSPSYAKNNPAAQAAFETLIASSSAVASWRGTEENATLAGSAFRSWFVTEKNRYFGPDIYIYNIE